MEIVDLIRERFVVGDYGTTFAGRQVLAGLKTEAAADAFRTDRLSHPVCAGRLAGIFQQGDFSLLRDVRDRVQIAGRSADVHRQQHLRRRRNRGGDFGGIDLE